LADGVHLRGESVVGERGRSGVACSRPESRCQPAASDQSIGSASDCAVQPPLDTVAEEVVQIVKVMTGLIRVRFASQPDLVVEWESASNVVAAPKPEDKPATGGTSGVGEVKPAA
jgi:hypothetical protein